METLVLLGIIIVLLSIFIPYIQSIRETSRRVICEKNLGQIRSALQYYARDNAWEFPRVRYDAKGNPSGYTAFTGADSGNPFAIDSIVQPNDVTASLWLLIRQKYLPDTVVFICPSSDGTRDMMTDASGLAVAPERRGNFRSPSNLSYSYASPFSSAPGYRLKPDLVASDFAVLADQNPGTAAMQPFDAPMDRLSHANSPNHGGAGQYVVYGDSHVEFQNTPYCGVGYKTKPPGDNIYTARFARSTTQPTSLPANAVGLVGHDVAPMANDDSYLVPTAEDTIPPLILPHPPPATTTAPASSTAPATTTTAPATTQ